MEALMCGASNVVISYGAIRGGPGGGTSGTQEKEKKQGISLSTVETARLGEKSTPASGNNGRSITLAPLPFPSTRNLVPAPLRFLWFPKKDTEKKKDDTSSSSSDRGKDVKTTEIDDALEEDRGKDVIRLSIEEDSSLDTRELLMVESGDLGLGLRESSETASDGCESEGSENDVRKVENGNAAKKWFQNLLTVNFRRKNPKIDARLPSTEILGIADERTTLSGNLSGEIASIQYDLVGENLEQAGVSSGSANENPGNACASAGSKCAGCMSESVENYAVDPAASPLSTLEVPHISVTHDLESFSKFLSEVPLTELKIIAQTSFLSNLAYLIPEIKPGELAKYHHMLYVTSSLDIKAEVREKETAGALAQEKAAAAARSEVDRSESGKKAKQESYLSPATAYALVVAAGSFLRSQKGSLPLPVEDSVNLNATEVGETELKQETNPLDADSMATFLGSESNSAGGSMDLDVSSSEMPAFMRPVTSVVSAENDTRQEVANNLRSLHTCPCEWFACDEKGSPTRFFSIQGSDSFASWQANLLFEPIQFEASDLGVMVHRGIYEAAIGLYEQILPYVFEHLNRYGERAKFRFTGHSLGGSLAVLLTLMLNIRGVVKTSSLLPVFTFGSPYIMCGGDYLLEKLGLPLTHVQYIVMHRDIVPRSFACNYPDHVAEVLKRVNGTFRDHSCLTRQRLLYAPMGQLMVLQPDQLQSSPHPLLPSGSGLYLIRHQSHNEPSVLNSADEVVPSRAVQVRAAQRAFLNQPHPLEIISDPSAYGPAGTISKHHDPRNYTNAINSVLRQEMRRWRRLQRERRRQHWWPLLSAESAIASSKGTNLGVQKDQRTSKGVTSQGMCRPSGLSHFVSDIAAGRATFPVSVSGDLAGRFSRYKSLIASQHVQMGLVVLFTAKMFFEQGFGVVLAWV